ncbi:MAG: helix-turn-helix transcriptional regulator [Saccharofermentanales bacterium]|jgi:putative transcriptional regulator
MRYKLGIARKIAELTQQEAADRIGVSRTTIQNWESYKTSPDATDMEKICEAYGLSSDEIIFSPKKLT